MRCDQKRLWLCLHGWHSHQCHLLPKFHENFTSTVSGMVWWSGHVVSHTCNRLRINYQFNPESNSWMWCWWQHFDHETFLQNSVLCHSVLLTPHVSNSAPAASERAKIEWHSKQSAVLRPFTPAKTNNFFMYVFNLTTNCGQRELKQLKCSGDDSYLLSICVWPEKHAYIMQKLEGR